MMFPQSLYRYTTSALGGFLVALLGACATNDPTAETQLAAVSRGDADKLLVVDCLLPGQIRKLGASMTYLSPRRPIKTTAGDCEIRGGEYVAYDRANYQTALAVWLPQAEAGDSKAQTYVGEIYERGLGTAPNYANAAGWYEKAATQGEARAQINLGALYEQGQGVRQDKVKAINLYRQASGLTGDQVAFSSSIQAIEAERDTLRTELAQRDREVDILRAQLGQTEKLLDTRRRRLEDTERALEETQRELQRQKSAPRPTVPGPTPAPSSDATIQRLEKRLADQQALLARQRQEFAYLQQEADRQQTQLRSELNAAETRASGLQADMAAANRTQQSLQQQVDYLQRELVAYQDRLNARKRELEEQRRQAQQAQQTQPDSAEVQRLQQELERRNRELTQTQQKVISLETEVQRRQEDLSNAERRVGDLQADVAAESRERESLQQQVDYQRSQLNAYQDRLNARKRELEEQRLKAQQAQQELETRKRSAAQTSAATQRLQQQLGDRTAALAQTQRQVAELEIEVQRRQRELEELRAISAEQTLASRAGGTTTMRSATPTTGSRPPRLDFGRYYALIIGNNRYQRFPDLETAVSDAQALARILQAQYGFRTRVLINADRYTILSALEEMRSQLTEKDNFLLYYAGHGELDRANDRGNWLPVDAEPNSRANWISNTAITDILNSMSAKHVMVIADSCYSGTLARATTTSLEGGRSEEKRTKWLKVMIDVRSRTVLTSGGVRPVLDTGGGEHSVFAKVLLAVLQSNQNVLEGPVLYRQVAQQVKSNAARLGVAQDPRYAQMRFAGDLGAPFFFVPGI